MSEATATRTEVARAVAAALAEPFEPREVKFKPQMVKNNRCLAMAYIDARLIQDRLDEVVGVENWRDNYVMLPDGSVQCRLSVRLDGRWVTKEDVGSTSEQPDQGDRLKAAFSDALKRAAVKFGIGRYLYRLSAAWVDYDPVKKQITQIPQLPAFALPKAKQGATKTAPKPGQPAPAAPKQSAPAPKVEPVHDPAPEKFPDFFGFLDMIVTAVDLVALGKVWDEVNRAVKAKGLTDAQRLELLAAKDRRKADLQPTTPAAPAQTRPLFDNEAPAGVPHL